jgi:hypothetical protein
VVAAVLVAAGAYIRVLAAARAMSPGTTLPTKEERVVSGNDEGREFRPLVERLLNHRS